MGEIIQVDFEKEDDFEPYMEGPATCSSCGHRWVAQMPIGDISTECPECLSHQGIMLSPVMPNAENADTQLLKSCYCGNEQFSIVIDFENEDQFVLCSRCGRTDSLSDIVASFKDITGT